MLGAVSRQVMYGLPFIDRFFYILFQLGGRERMIDSYPLRFLVQGGLRSHSNDVVDGEFMAKDDFFILVDIDHGAQACEIQSEEIKKG